MDYNYEQLYISHSHIKICESLNIYNRKDAEVDAGIQYLTPFSPQKSLSCVVSAEYCPFSVAPGNEKCVKDRLSLATHLCL